MRIVIVGAGTGGTLTANLLAKALRKQIRAQEMEICIVEPKGDHSFQPGNLDVAFKGVAPKRFLRPTKPLLHKRVNHHSAAASKIDVGAQEVQLDDGTVLGYDFLVLATGAMPRANVIPGLTEGGLSFHEGPKQAERIWHALEKLDGGRVVVAITEMPYKCPPSPNEACFLLHDLFKSRGDRDKFEIELLTPMPRAYPAEAISDQVQSRFDERGITLRPFFMTESVDADRKVICNLEGEEVPYDLLLAIPPHRGAPVITDSGLGDAEGFIVVDKETMRLPSNHNVFAIGDCTALPISKSGVVAHLEALVVVKNILAELGFAEGEWAYNGRINCPMEVGDHKLLWVSATYTDPPEQNAPTHIKYGMKKAFGRMYWQVLSGSLEWLMSIYFGETAKRRPEIVEAPVNEELEA